MTSTRRGGLCGRRLALRTSRAKEARPPWFRSAWPQAFRGNQGRRGRVRSSAAGTAIAGTWVQSGAARTQIVRTLVIAAVPRDGRVLGTFATDYSRAIPSIRWVRLQGHTVWHGWYGPEAMQLQPRLPRRHELEGGTGITVFYVLDPRLVPLWIGSLAVAWTIKSRRTLGKRLDRGLLIDGRAECGDLLGLDPATGRRPDSCSMRQPEWRPSLAVTWIEHNGCGPPGRPVARAPYTHAAELAVSGARGRHSRGISRRLCQCHQPSAAISLEVEQIFRDDESTNVGAAIPGGRAVDVDVSLAKLATKSRTRKDRTGVGE